MRVRIIFRGLMLFKFEKPEGATRKGSSTRGKLKALLVNHPMEAMSSGATSHAMAGMSHEGHDMSMPASMPPGHMLHMHVPRISIYGRDVATNRPVIETGIRLEPGETSFDLNGVPRDGVSKTKGFDAYVPDLAKLRPTKRGRPRPEFYRSWITVPHGRLRARDLVTWDIDAMQAAEIGFMGTNFRGYMASEAVLDIGDDSDFTDDRKSKYLSIRSTTKGIPERLWPLTKGVTYAEETDPNTVEILVTNFPPQGRRPLPWSLHFESLFDAVGYPRDLKYENSEQYRKFMRAVKSFDPYEWDNDVANMGLGQPFPFLIPDSRETLPGIKKAPRPAVMNKTPKDAGPRTKDDGVPSKRLEAHDPWSRPICPFGQDGGGQGGG